MSSAAGDVVYIGRAFFRIEKGAEEVEGEPMEAMAPMITARIGAMVEPAEWETAQKWEQWEGTPPAPAPSLMSGAEMSEGRRGRGHVTLPVWGLGGVVLLASGVGLLASVIFLGSAPRVPTTVPVGAVAGRVVRAAPVIEALAPPAPAVTLASLPEASAEAESQPAAAPAARTRARAEARKRPAPAAPAAQPAPADEPAGWVDPFAN